MNSILYAMQMGGPVMYVLLAVFLLGLMGVLAFGMAGLAKVRVPLVLWLLAPLLLLVAGLGGTVQGLMMTHEAVVYASLDTRPLLASAGLSASLITTRTGLLGAAVLLVLSTWGASAAAALYPGEERSGSAIPAVLGGGLALLAGAGILVGSAVMGDALVKLSAAVLLCAPALALAGLRQGTGEDLARQAEHRLSVAVCAVGAALCAAAATGLGGTMVIHEALAHASAESRAMLIAQGIMHQQHAMLFGTVALGAVGIGGALSAGSAARAAPIGRTAASAVITGLGLLLGGGLAGIIAVQVSDLEPYWPAAALEGIEARISNLPKDITVDGESGLATSPAGYSDILVSEGGRWVPLAEGGSTPPFSVDTGFYGESPEVLLVAPADLPAASLVQTAWGEGDIDLHLLTGADIPEEARDSRWASHQWRGTVPITWVPEFTEEETDAGSTNDGLFEATVARISPYTHDEALFVIGTDTGAELIRFEVGRSSHASLAEAGTAMVASLQGHPTVEVVLVPGPGWTVQDVVTLCTTASLQDDVVCTLLEEYAPPAVIPVDGASGGPAPIITGNDPVILGPIDRELVVRVVETQRGAFQRCYQRADSGVGGLRGRVIIKFTIAASGQVSSATVKSSSVNSSTLERCLADAFMDLDFPAAPHGGINVISYPLTFARG